MNEIDTIDIKSIQIRKYLWSKENLNRIYHNSNDISYLLGSFPNNFNKTSTKSIIGCSHRQPYLVIESCLINFEIVSFSISIAWY